MSISANYRPLLSEEARQLWDKYSEAWKHPAIPIRQYESAVKPELASYRKGGKCAPFDALVECLSGLRGQYLTFLDAGASCGYYDEVLKLRGFCFDYTGMDYSPAFRDLALRLYPNITFHIGDVANLEYGDGSFDVVMSAAVMMHTPQYERVIAEAARVSSRYVVFHRTPILSTRPTMCYLKEGYGVTMMEIHFNERRLLDLFAVNQLNVIKCVDVFRDRDGEFGHRTYLTEKEETKVA